MMANKTFSQKAARVFEIVCYILLVPVFILIFLTLSGGALVLIPLFITGLGLVLLYGYRKHARGTFDRDKLILLWLGTLAFNGIPLTPIFYQVIFNSDKIGGFKFENFFNTPTLLIFLLISWWIIMVSFSITFIIDELRRDARIK